MIPRVSSRRIACETTKTDDTDQTDDGGIKRKVAAVALLTLKNASATEERTAIRRPS